MRMTDLWVIAPWTLAACVDEGARTITPVEEWTTEAEYEIGDRMQGDALFGPYIALRSAADGSRVYVLDSQASQVTMWTPEGVLVKRLGRAGGGPGEFQSPSRLTLLHDGFYVKDHRRITTFTLDGELTGTEPYPRGVEFGGFPVQIRDVFNDGSFAALPLPAVLDGSMTNDPAKDLAVLRISEKDGSWETDELALLDFRNWSASISFQGVQGPIPFGQPWVTPDHFQVDHLIGSVVIKRAPAINPGLIELIEISTAGDTLWTRRIQLPPVPVTEEQIKAEVEEWAAIIAESFGDITESPMLKSRIRAAWVIPEFWPAVREIRLMSNGEIWFEPLGRDTPGVWYAVRKGADEGPIRQITVPASFQPRDITATHVWGIRRDELDVGYVTGLRLVPGPETGSQ